MDPRVNEHARTLVDWGARVEAGDHVVIDMGPEAHDLAVALAEILGERGATYHTTYSSGEIDRAYLTSISDTIPEPSHERALFKAADVVLQIGGGRNRSAMVDVPSDREQAGRLATKTVREARYDTRWMSTVHPTRSLAQAAAMSFEGYRDFAYGAMLRDWQALADEMARLKDFLDSGDIVRIVSEGTDIQLSIANRTAVNSAASVAYDSHNLPSGEVFTAPEGADGIVTFDIPMVIRGQPVRNVRLTFDDGEVTALDADEGASVIKSLVDTDAGSRRLGELGIGMNREITRYTNHILFDEKMGGTVHLALGRAYDACLPDGESGNDSAVHVDLLCDMTDESRIEIDGETIQRNGIFSWEPNFPG